MATTTERKQVNVSLRPDMASWVEGISELMFQPMSATVTNLLDLLWSSMKRELSLIPYTVGELRFLVQVSLGSMLTVGWGRVLSVNVEDELGAMREMPGGITMYEEDFGFNGEALLSKLDRLSPLGDYAVREALARFIRDPQAEADEAGFTAYGFRVIGNAK